MNTYIKIKTVETGARLFSSDYSTFNVEKKYFDTLEAAREHLREKYGKAKRGKMYCKPDGKQCGYIYKFRNADWSHAPVEKWNQCDWVSISEVNEKTLV